MELTILRSDDQVTQVALAGKFDLAGVQQIELKFTAVTASRRKPAVVDLTEVSYLASLGVRVLLSTARALSAQGQKMMLVNPQPQVLQVLQMGKVDSIIPVSPDVAAAFAALGVK